MAITSTVCPVDNRICNDRFGMSIIEMVPAQLEAGAGCSIMNANILVGGRTVHSLQGACPNAALSNSKS